MPVGRLDRARELMLASRGHGVGPAAAGGRAATGWRLVEADSPDPPDEQAVVQARLLITLANAEFELFGLDRAMDRLDVAAEVVAARDLRPRRSLSATSAGCCCCARDA